MVRLGAYDGVEGSIRSLGICADEGLEVGHGGCATAEEVGEEVATASHQEQPQASGGGARPPRACAAGAFSAHRPLKSLGSYWGSLRIALGSDWVGQKRGFQLNLGSTVARLRGQLLGACGDPRP